MSAFRLSVKWIAACLMLAAIPLITVAQTTPLAGTSDTFYCSGLIGLSKDQTASISYTNMDREVKDVRFYFFDADGSLLKSSSARVSPGQSLGLELSYRELRIPEGGLARIRGTVRLTTPPEPDATPPEPDLGMSSLNIFDEATSRVTFGLLLPAVRSSRIYFPFND
ncbi:MAG TPA: hypothetical protein VKA60_01500 [Blastocatellia bacterium]|nr:hypothetical protein [Blastocatellia bacterium]